jgi:hypothetical protein
MENKTKEVNQVDRKKTQKDGRKEVSELSPNPLCLTLSPN